MTEQLTLDQAAEIHLPQGRGTPTDRWQRACATNPGLREAFADTAEQLQTQGVRATANRVAEEMRDRFRTVGTAYRFDNSWRAPAAAELRERRPDLARDMTTRRDRRG